MRTRLATIAAISLAAVIGTATAAQAYPQGPGGMSDKPTTTTTAPPKGPDKVAPTPTTQPPKGPGDLATPTTQPPQPGPGPKGPGDIAQPQPDPVVDPGPMGNGSGSDKDYLPPTTPGDDEAGVGETSVNVDGNSVETIPVADTEGAASNDESTEAAADETENEGGLSPFVLLGAAVMVAGLIAFAVARRRGDEQDAEQI